MSLKEFNYTDLPASSQNCSDDSGFLVFFENYLTDVLDSLDQPVRDLAKGVVLSGGKRLRPLLTFHCGSDSPDVTEDLLKVSAILELVHVATLVHDDILDASLIRRSQPTLHTQIGEHSSILLGDALFSYALELASEFPTTKICKLVSKATRRTCSGEIMQNFNKGNFKLSFSDYSSIIQDKTGELFKASCQAGAYLSGHSSHVIDVVGEFGLSLGLNYQILDDLVDTFGTADKAGKSLGTDFIGGKITLPLILLFEGLTLHERKKVIGLLSADPSKPSTREVINNLMIEHQIQTHCIKFLRNNLIETKNIVANIASDGISRRLTTFLSSFDEKLAFVLPDLTANLLACDD